MNSNQVSSLRVLCVAVVAFGCGCGRPSEPVASLQSAVVQSMPPLILSYFDASQMIPAFMGIDSLGNDTGRRPLAQLPAGTPVYLGNYGVDTSLVTGGLIAQAQTTTTALLHYAPMFSLVSDDGYTLRPPGTVDDFDSSGGALFDYSQPIPPAASDGSWSPDSISAAVDAVYADPAMRNRGSFQWGQELGKRMRDTIERYNATGPGVRVETWQFDEISPSAALDPNLASRDEYRELLRGVMIGLTFGRSAGGVSAPEMHGIVFIANSAFGVGSANPDLDPEITDFWSSLSVAAMYIVGEEYPTPDDGGDHEHPGQAGIDAADVQYANGQGLYRGWVFLGDNDVGDAIGSKWIAGMSPGYSPEEFTGAAPPTMSRQFVNDFREYYSRERATANGPRGRCAGFGEYSWIGGNVNPVVADDTLRGVAVGLNALMAQAP